MDGEARWQLGAQSHPRFRRTRVATQLECHGQHPCSVGLYEQRDLVEGIHRRPVAADRSIVSRAEASVFGNHSNAFYLVQGPCRIPGDFLASDDETSFVL